MNSFLYRLPLRFRLDQVILLQAASAPSIGSDHFVTGFFCAFNWINSFRYRLLLRLRVVRPSRISIPSFQCPNNQQRKKRTCQKPAYGFLKNTIARVKKTQFPKPAYLFTHMLKAKSKTHKKTKTRKNPRSNNNNNSRSTKQQPKSTTQQQQNIKNTKNEKRITWLDVLKHTH
jgi:hypothetical protein